MNFPLGTKSFKLTGTELTLKTGGKFVPEDLRVYIPIENMPAADIIKVGETFFGVTGTYTADATATPEDILKDKTAYVNGTKIKGEMVNNGTVHGSVGYRGTYRIPKGYHDGNGTVNSSVSAGLITVTSEISGLSLKSGTTDKTNKILKDSATNENSYKLTITPNAIAKDFFEGYIGSDEYNVIAADSVTKYIDKGEYSASIELTAGAGSVSGSNVSFTTTNNGISVSGKGSVSATATAGITKEGYIEAGDSSSDSDELESSTETKYISGVNIPKDTSFTISMTEDTSIDTTSDLSITTAKNRTVRINGGATKGVLVSGENGKTVTVDGEEVTDNTGDLITSNASISISGNQVTLTDNKGWHAGSTSTSTIPAGTISTGTVKNTSYQENVTAIVPSKGYLYIGAGYYPNTQISLDTLLGGGETEGSDPSIIGTPVNANYLVSGYTAYTVDGELIKGAMQIWNPSSTYYTTTNTGFGAMPANSYVNSDTALYIKQGSVSLSGGDVSATAGVSSTNAGLSTTNSSGIEIIGTADASSSDINPTVTQGWVSSLSKFNGKTATQATSKKYLSSISLSTGKTLSEIKFNKDSESSTNGGIVTSIIGTGTVGTYGATSGSDVLSINKNQGTVYVKEGGNVKFGGRSISGSTTIVENGSIKSASISGEITATEEAYHYVNGTKESINILNETKPSDYYTVDLKPSLGSISVTPGWISSSSGVTLTSNNSERYIKKGSVTASVSTSSSMDVYEKPGNSTTETKLTSNNIVSTSKPTSGGYYKLQAKSSATATAGAEEGYVLSSASATDTGSANKDYYLAKGSITLSAEDVNSGGNFEFTGSNVKFASSNNGISVTSNVSSSLDATYNLTPGYISAADVKIDSSSLNLTSSPKYISEITVPKDIPFKLTMTSDSALDDTSNLTISNASFRRVNITNATNGTVNVGTTTISGAQGKTVSINSKTVTNDSGALITATPAFTGGGITGGGLTQSGNSGGGLTATSNYSGTPTVKLSNGSDTNISSGIVSIGSKNTTDYPYYIKVNASSSALSGTTTVTRAAFSNTVTRAAIGRDIVKYSNAVDGWVNVAKDSSALAANSSALAAATSKVELGSTTCSPTVTVNAGSGSTYVGLKAGGVSLSGSLSKGTASGGGLSGGGLTVTSNYSATPTVDISLDSQTTSGFTITDSQPSSGYYVKLSASSSSLSGKTKATRAAVKRNAFSQTVSGTSLSVTKTAGYIESGSTSFTGSETVTLAEDSTTIPSTYVEPTVTVGAGSKTEYLVVPAGTISTGANSKSGYSNNTSAVVPAGGYLYIGAGYYPNTQISLSTLIPDDSSYTNAGTAQIRKNYEAYNSSGTKLIGTIEDLALNSTYYTTTNTGYGKLIGGTYVPEDRYIKSATPTFIGGDLSGGGLTQSGNSGGGLTATSNYEGTPAVTFSNGSDANISSSVFSIGNKDTTNYPYYIKVNAASNPLSGTTTVTRAAFSNTVTRAAVSRSAVTYASAVNGWVKKTTGASALSSGSMNAATSTVSLSSTTCSPTVTVNAGSGSTYIGLKKAAMTITPTIVGPTITPSVSISRAGYGITTTKPSGTFVTIDPGASVTSNGSVSASGKVSSAGYLALNETITSESSSISSSNTTINSGTNYYIPIVSPSFTGGGLSGGGLTQSGNSGGGLSKGTASGGGLSGGGLTQSGNSGGSLSASGSNVTLSDSNNGIAVTFSRAAFSNTVTRAAVTRAAFSQTVTRAAFSNTVTRAAVDRAAVTYNGAVNGLISKANGTSALSASNGALSSTTTTVSLAAGSETVSLAAGTLDATSSTVSLAAGSITKYITGVNIPSGNTFTVGENAGTLVVNSNTNTGTFKYVDWKVHRNNSNKALEFIYEG